MSAKKQAVSRGGEQPAFWLLLHCFLVSASTLGGGGQMGAMPLPPHDFSPAAGFLFDECVVIFDEYLLARLIIYRTRPFSHYAGSRLG